MLAHFTSHELPGTLGLVLAAFALGLLAAHRQLRPHRSTVPLLAVLAVTVVFAVLADQPGVHLAGGWLAGTVDVVMLATAAVLCARGLRGPGTSRRLGADRAR